MDINSIRTHIPILLKELFNETIPDLMQASILSFMNNTGPTRGKNITSTLRIQSGRLARSFKRNTNENIFDISENNNVVRINYGSSVPYARIHEYGGRTGRNHKTVIPKRPYMQPGMELFNEKYLPKIINNYIHKVLNLLEKIK